MSYKDEGRRARLREVAVGRRTSVRNTKLSI